MPIQTCWELAQRWYMGRIERDWERLSAEQAQALFGDLGLEGEFWRIV